MGQLSLEIFDRSLEKSNEWVEELMRELGWSDAHRTLGAFRAAIHTLRDRLPVAQAVGLAADLPLLLRGLYFEGWRPLEHGPVLRHHGETLHHLDDAASGLEGEESVSEVMRAVLRVLDRHVSRGEIDRAQKALPPELRVLWPSGAA